MILSLLEEQSESDSSVEEESVVHERKPLGCCELTDQTFLVCHILVCMSVYH